MGYLKCFYCFNVLLIEFVVSDPHYNGLVSVPRLCDFSQVAGVS